MELTEFAFGIILTIVGVVTVELFILFIKEKNETHKLLKSLEFEVAENVDILNTNVDKRNKGEFNDYLLFRTDAYYNFKQSISSKLLNELESESVRSLFVGYNLCEDFNRKYVLGRENTVSIEEYCFTTIKNNFEYFLRIREWKDN